MSKHVDDNCIFCKIAAGTIPSSSIYEDEDFKVILDINPASKGHAVILPKNHAARHASKKPTTILAKKCGAAMMKTLNCDGLNVLQNNGEAAGQTVFHLHTHLIPRYNGDTVNIGWQPGAVEDAEKLAQEIKNGF